MKTLEWCCALAAALLLSGCQTQSRNPTAPTAPAGPVFDTPAGPVRVLAVSHKGNGEEKTIEAMLLVQDRLRRMVLRPYRTPVLPVGLDAELSQADGSLLFGVQFAWDPKKPDVLFMTERTASDMLTITIERGGHVVREEYSARGRTMTVEYPRSEADPSGAWEGPHFGAVDRSKLRADADNDKEDMYAKALELERFYRRNVGDRLSDNPDGEVLVSLLNDRRFAMDGLEIPDGYFENLGEEADRICMGALRCMMVKCKWGGLQNPLCVACAGTTAACVIATIACYLTDCGNNEENKEGN